MKIPHDKVKAFRAAAHANGYLPVAVHSATLGVQNTGKRPKAARWQSLPSLDGTEPVGAENTGIRCDNLYVPDIDIDEPAIAAAIMAIVEDTLGKTIMRYRDGSPRVAFVYAKADEGPPISPVVGLNNTKDCAIKVDLLGGGGARQFVAHGYHYTGKQLRWRADLSPADVPLDLLPRVTHAQMLDLRSRIAAVVGDRGPEGHAQVNGKHHGLLNGAGFDALETPASSLGQEARHYEDIAAALEVIPNEPTGWEPWKMLGMAIRGAVGEDGFELFDSFSQKCPEMYDPENTERAWDEITRSPPSTLGAGRIIYLAKQANPAWVQPSMRPGFKPEGMGLPKAAPGVPSRGFPLRWFEDMEAVLDVRDFVEDTLIENSAVVVYGKSNAGKTFWVTDLALHIAAGKSWNGKQVDQGGVIYCALEGGQGLGNRVAAWKRNHYREGEALPFAATTIQMDLLDPDGDTEQLIETIRQAVLRMPVPVKLIVIDTLARALSGGNENSSEAMGSLVANMDRIRAATGAAVLFIHHSGKDEARGARGHSSLTAAIDTEIEVVDLGGAMTATVVKQRDMPKGQVYTFGLKVETLGVNRRGKPITSCVPVVRGNPVTVEQKEPPHRVALNRLAAVAVGGPVTDKVWRDSFYETMEGTERRAKEQAFLRAKRSLLAQGLVVQENGCFQPKITDKGRTDRNEIGGDNASEQVGDVN